MNKSQILYLPEPVINLSQQGYFSSVYTPADGYHSRLLIILYIKPLAMPEYKIASRTKPFRAGIDKLILLSCLLILYSFHSNHLLTGRDIIKKMHEQYYGKWYHTLSYTQKMEFFKKGKFNGSQFWYASILFPTVFRIDYVDPKKRNTDIITRDTLWEFRKGLLRNIIPGMGDAVFLSGGLYSYSLDEDYQKLKDMGYDLDKSFRTIWNNKPVYVIGAIRDGEPENQIWVDAVNLYIVRQLNFFGKNKQDQVLESQVKLDGGWSETKASIYLNDTLSAVQSYQDLVVNKALDLAGFDPGQYLVHPTGP